MLRQHFGLLVVAAAVAVAAAVDDRLCPGGYVYSGEDSPFVPDDEVQPRDYYYEEADRSPVYSCYKLVEQKTTWMSAMNACWEEDSQLASFEDELEMHRVAAHYGYKVSGSESSDDDDDDHEENAIDPSATFDFFTSGMYFEDVGKWYWLSSNRSVSDSMEIENEVDEEETAISSVPRDCLMFRMMESLDDGGSSDLVDSTLVANNCFATAYYMCEARVQTVTYYTWFYANWVEMLLGFVLVILFVALCVAVCAYSSHSKRQYYGSRSNFSNTTTRRAYQYGGNNNSNSRQTKNVTAVEMDIPPAYEQAVRVHAGKSSASASGASTSGANVSGTNAEEEQKQQTASRMDYYRNRGKDLMAKVYLYKDKPKTTEENSNSPTA